MAEEPIVKSEWRVDGSAGARDLLHRRRVEHENKAALEVGVQQAGQKNAVILGGGAGCRNEDGFAGKDALLGAPMSHVARLDVEFHDSGAGEVRAGDQVGELIIALSILVVVDGRKLHGLRFGQRTSGDEGEIDQGDGESFDGGLLFGEDFLHDGFDVRSLIHVRRLVRQHVHVQQLFFLILEGVDLMSDEDVVGGAHLERFHEDAVRLAHDVELEAARLVRLHVSAEEGAVTHRHLAEEGAIIE